MRFLITGANGQLGAYLLRQLANQTGDVVAWSGSRTGRLFGHSLCPVDLANRDRVAAAFREARPTAVIHAAAMSTIISCYRDPQSARRVNVDASILLTELAEEAKATLLFVSTDLVFDGERGWYDEQDAVSPGTVYGKTKAAAEQAVLASPRVVVVRLSLLFGPSLIGRPTPFDEQLRALREQRTCRLYEDEWRTPLSFPAAAQGLLAVAQSDCRGLLHMGGSERLSRLDMGRSLARVLNLDASMLVPATRLDPSFAETRPRDTSLNSSRWSDLFSGQAIQTWDASLREMVEMPIAAANGR